MNTEKYLEVVDNYNLFSKLEKLKKISKEREVVFLCVGNSKVWFDSFGPIMGSLLMFLNLEKFIYGNLRRNIKADNLEEYIDMIYRFHNNPYIVVIDNAISTVSEPSLKIKEGSTKCAGFSSNPIEVGDLSILLSFSQKHLKDSCNYSNILLNAKKVARFINFIFNS